MLPEGAGTPGIPPPLGRPGSREASATQLHKCSRVRRRQVAGRERPRLGHERGAPASPWAGLTTWEAGSDAGQGVTLKRVILCLGRHLRSRLCSVGRGQLESQPLRADEASLNGNVVAGGRWRRWGATQVRTTGRLAGPFRALATPEPTSGYWVHRPLGSLGAPAVPSLRERCSGHGTGAVWTQHQALCTCTGSPGFTRKHKFQDDITKGFRMEAAEC